jgi:hypothetical protein
MEYFAVSWNACFFGKENKIINNKVEIRSNIGYLKKLYLTLSKAKAKLEKNDDEL